MSSYLKEHTPTDLLSLQYLGVFLLLMVLIQIRITANPLWAELSFYAHFRAPGIMLFLGQNMNQIIWELQNMNMRKDENNLNSSKDPFCQ